MKKVFKVYKRDIKSIFTNPVALIIVIGLCIIPSLYAWVNIKASWDPYTNTSDIPVAIVNNDQGATLNGKPINVGNDVVNELKSNKSIGWKFVNQKNGDLGVMDGTYYALIEIPANFSKNLASLTSDNPVKADIIYKVNTKLNPVANKITDVAEDTLVNQIKTTFVQTVNTEVFGKLNIAGNNIDQNKNNILKLKSSIINVNNNMDLINNVLSGVNSGAVGLNSYLQSVKTALPQLSSGLTNIQNITVNTGDLISNTNSTLNSAFDNISTNLQVAQAEVNRINGQISNISVGDSADQAKNTITTVKAQLSSVNDAINPVITFLESINKTNSSQAVSSMIDNLNGIQGVISGEQTNLDNLASSIDQAGVVKQSALDAAQSGGTKLSTAISNAIANYNNNTRPALNTIGNGLESSTKTAGELINNANGLVTKMSDIVNNASTSTELAASTATSLQGTLNQFKGVISELAKNLSAINNENLNQIVSVMQGNPSAMGDFMATPFNVKTESIFPVANYGSGMTPVYTVLALWVGALLLTSLLKVYPVNMEGLEDTSIRDRHFGKMLTFLSIGIIQSLIVALGDKYLLGVQTVSLSLLILFSVATAITFGIIIFTLVSLFGNMGKAIAIVLMVVQLAGTGGTYPVQVLPLFFRMVAPLVPFPYAIEGFREAIAGPLASHVFNDFKALFIFSVIFILIGYFIKPILDAPMKKFEEKFEESGIGE